MGFYWRFSLNEPIGSWFQTRMHLIRIIAVLTLFTSLALPVLADAPVLSNASGKVSSNTSTTTSKGEHGHGKETKGLPKRAPLLFYGIGGDAKTDKVGPLAVTNSMLVMFVVAIGIILVAQAATRRAQLIPAGLQNFVEWLVESLYGFFEGIVGPELVKKTFWFFATVFILILFSNWFGLLPGLGTIGWDVDSHGHVHKPLLRGVNADLNMTLSMAAIFMVLWLFWCIREIGVKGFAGHLFNVTGHGAGFFGIFLVVVFIFVGLIEVVSIGVRPVALTFRLYGNIFAGENMLETVMKLGGPYLGWLAVLPFYFLEILVGLVQALVFALLTSVFTALMCEHHEEGNAH